MSLIGIIIGIVFLFLLGRAILETLWGLCLIANGIFWHTIAFAFDALGLIIRGFKRLRAIALW